MAEPIISRVYDIKVSSYDDALKKVNSLTDAFNRMDAAKRKLNTELQRKLEAGDAAAIKGLSDKIKELEKNLKDLGRQRDASAKEALLLAKAEKEQAAATKENAAAAKIRNADLIQQEKELDRLIEKERKQNKTLQESTGYYYQLLKAQKETLQAYRIALPDNPGYDKIKKDAIEAKARVDAFNRSLSPDGTLVGEYRTGIVNAFRDLGLNDVIRRQKDDINNQLNQLKKQAQDLASEYKKTGSAGADAFKNIDLQLRQNIEEQERLKKSLDTIANGNIGNQITTSIGGAFKNIKGDIARAALAYVSFQGIVSGVESVFANTVKLDSLDASLKVVSGSEKELAENNKFLQETTKQLGLEYISSATAFKNFYAASTQAGIGAEQTRDIYFAAAAAAANLKLSQEDTNGVLLAFSQIASKGKVQAEELRGQIGERVPGAFAIAARAIGVTQVELNKMLENGQVIASEFLPKFAAELQKTFGGDTTKKVEGLQASVNSLKNKFTELLVDNQSGLTVFFNLFLGFVSLLIGNLPLIISLFSLWTIGWIALNKEMIFSRAILPVITVLFGGAERATRAWAVATQFLTRVKGLLLQALQNPYFRIFAGVIGSIVLAMTSFAGAVDNSIQKLGALGQQQRFLAETTATANKQISETIAREQVLLGIIKDRTLADQVRKKALEDLKNIMGQYGEALTLENVLTEKGTASLKAYNEQLLLKAKVSAASAIAQRESAKLATLFQYQTDIATAQISKGSINTSQFDKEFLDKYYQQQGRTASQIGKFIGDKIGIDFTYSGKDLQAFAKLVDSEIKAQLEKVKGAEINKFNIDSLANEGAPKGVNSVSETVFEAFARLVKGGGTEAQFEQLKKDIDAQKAKFNILSKEYKDLVQLEKDLEEFLNPKKDKPASASKLTGQQKDAFKDIDANRDEQIAIEKAKFTQLITNEEEYLNNVLKINLNAANQKLDLLKGKTAEERKVIAELKLYKLEQEEDTNNKLFALASKRLEQALDDAKKQAELKYGNTVDDPTKTPLEKIKAREEYLATLQVLQSSFNSQMDQLEKKYNQKSGDNAQKRKDTLLDIARELNKTMFLITKEGYDQQLRLAEEASKRQINESKQRTAERVISILNDQSLSTSAQALAIKRVQSEETINLLAQEVAAAKIAFETKENGLKKNLATETEVSDAKTRLKLAELALLKAVSEQEQGYLKKISDSLKDAYHNIVDFFKGVKKTKQQNDEELNAALSQAGQYVTQAINQAQQAYFDNLRKNVETEKELSLQRLDILERQLIAQAQSENEKLSIQRQYDAKRKEEEKKAAEERKKIALKEATLNYAVAVIKTLAQYAFPFSLLPVAGLTLLYLAQRSSINAQQFAKGGKVQGPVSSPVHELGPGPVRTPQNIPVQPNGDNVLATVKRGEVILNEDQQRKLGGARTFAKIGVPGFAGGGIAGMGNFNLGASLKPPTNPSSFLSGNQSGDDNGFIFAAIDQQTRNINALGAQVNKRIDRLKVVLDPREVEASNNKTKKAQAIGNI